MDVNPPLSPQSRCSGHWHKNSNARVECRQNSFSHSQCATSQSHSCARPTPLLKHFPSPIRCAVFAKRVDACSIGICPTTHRVCPRFALFLAKTPRLLIVLRVARCAHALPVRSHALVAKPAAHRAMQHRLHPKPLARFPDARVRPRVAYRVGGALSHPAHLERVSLASGVHGAR